MFMKDTVWVFKNIYNRKHGYFNLHYFDNSVYI